MFWCDLFYFNFQLCVLSYYVSLCFEFRGVMSVTISHKSDVRTSSCLWEGSFIIYVIVPYVACFTGLSFLIAPSVFSNVYFLIVLQLENNNFSSVTKLETYWLANAADHANSDRHLFLFRVGVSERVYLALWK